MIRRSNIAALVLSLLGTAPFIANAFIPPTLSSSALSNDAGFRATRGPYITPRAVRNVVVAAGLLSVNESGEGSDIDSTISRRSKREIARKIVISLARNAAKTLPAAALLDPHCVWAASAASESISTSLRAQMIFGAAVTAAIGVGGIASKRRKRLTSTTLGATANIPDTADESLTPSFDQKQVPITILAGFLGAGKTTVLKRLLENTEGIKIGTVVNDMASVNIDAKLISNPMNGDTQGGNSVGTGSSGTVELQNGCACCSLSDELLTSVLDLMDGRELDAIVVELSGVADPVAVKKNWMEATSQDHPATKLAQLNRIVTIVDSHTFGTDWMTWDTARTREWTVKGDTCAGSRQVPELLAEQVEAADIIVLNKVDLSEGEQLVTARTVVRSLNDDAELIETKFGELTTEKIIGDALTVKEEPIDGNPDGEPAGSAPHAHSAECADPTCTDHSRDHSHSHSHATSTDNSNSHGEPAGNAPHAHSAECADPTCTDHSHDHSHSHSHATSTDNLGISNFVYTSKRPFDSSKLFQMLLTWPIPVMEELSIGKIGEGSTQVEDDTSKKEDSPFVGILRSKGFTWISPSVFSGPFNDLDRHDTVFYWSHAGKHFGLKEAGSWWASVEEKTMKEAFKGNMKEYVRILKEDFVNGEWGDRRQEVVFIGANLDEEGIKAALDSCLCTDEQIETYKQLFLNAVAEMPSS